MAEGGEGEQDDVSFLRTVRFQTKFMNGHALPHGTMVEGDRRGYP